MTSKFNKEMYKKIKEKKNEPLSSIGQKKLRFTDKEKEKEKEKEMVERGLSTPILELDGQEASPGVSVEEVARPLKRLKVGGKGRRRSVPASGLMQRQLWIVSMNSSPLGK